MMLYNKTDKLVSRKLPDGSWVSLEPGESYDFPNLPIYNEDHRLGGWSKPSASPKSKKPKKLEELVAPEEVYDPADVNKDGKVDAEDVLSVATKAVKKVFGKKSKKGKK